MGELSNNLTSIVVALLNGNAKLNQNTFKLIFDSLEKYPKALLTIVRDSRNPYLMMELNKPENREIMVKLMVQLGYTEEEVFKIFEQLREIRDKNGIESKY